MHNKASNISFFHGFFFGGWETLDICDYCGELNQFIKNTSKNCKNV